MTPRTVGGLANPASTPSGTRHVPVGGRPDTILAGLVALGHGQLLAQTSISRRKKRKKRTHKQDKDSNPRPRIKPQGHPHWATIQILSPTH
jgi:hypothetical protein